MPTISDTTNTNTSAGAGAHALPGWLKGALQAGGIVFACWAGAIAFWRLHRSAPTTGELALCLVGIPSLLVLAFFASNHLFGRRKSSPALPAPAASGNDVAAVPPQAASLAILAAAVRSAHGTSPDELASTLAAGKARADLDPELVDDDGFPVMSVRSLDARDDALQDDIADWLAHHGMADLRFSDEQWRALVLGSAITEELAGHAVRRLLSPGADPSSLRLALLLPPDWSADHRQAAGMWFEHVAQRCGWPADRLHVAADMAPHAAAPAAALDRLARDAATGARITALVVACASQLGDDTIARWSAQGLLFISHRPQGWIPGEGAAGLLLVDLPQAATLDDPDFALLTPLQEGRRTTSADESRRADASSLGEAAERAISLHGDGATVTRIVADTGHRSSRVLELMGFMIGAMPQLDEVDDAIRVGEACGTCAAVPFMTALAVGTHYVLEEETAVLCLSNEDPYLRSAVLMQPGHAARQQ